MKFLCLVYLAPGALSGLTQDEQAELDRESIAYEQALQRDGRFLAASALQSASTARTIRRKGGAPVVMDGPFAETKEVLAGFIFIDAADYSQAIEIAKGIPVGRFGAIEVRPELDIG